jgi:hypothetical protein
MSIDIVKPNRYCPDIMNNATTATLELSRTLSVVAKGSAGYSQRGDGVHPSGDRDGT